MNNVIVPKNFDQIVSITVNGQKYFYAGIKRKTPLKQVQENYNVKSMSIQEIKEKRKKFKPVKTILFTTNIKKAIFFDILPSYRFFATCKEAIENNDCTLI
jgi:hypothetical protein